MKTESKEPLEEIFRLHMEIRKDQYIRGLLIGIVIGLSVALALNIIMLINIKP